MYYYDLKLLLFEVKVEINLPGNIEMLISSFSDVSDVEWVEQWMACFPTETYRCWNYAEKT